MKEVVGDAEEGNVSHLEIELTQQVSKEVLWAEHGGIINKIAVKAISGAQSDFKAGKNRAKNIDKTA